MKISILSPDLSQNCLVRPYLIAKMLVQRYEVEIIGPVFGNGVWSAVREDPLIRFIPVDFKGHFKPYLRLRELVGKATGDIIYASKPMLTSFGVGIVKKMFGKRPLLLDIEDWDLGFIIDGLRKASFPARLKALTAVLEPFRLDAIVNTWTMEKLTGYADAVTVSNEFLRRKFGGEIICHARDTSLFDPSKYDNLSTRRHYGVPQEAKVIVFSGTPRPWKGIEDLVEALSIINEPRVFLIIAGSGQDNYCREISKTARRYLGKSILELGLIPFNKVPEILCMADLVAVPQTKSLATLGQVPAKIYDAMAMAKPVVTTAVSDLPEIIEGCGWIVKPGNPGELAAAMKYILEHPDEANEAGIRARRRCLEKYSLDVVARRLFDIVEKAGCR